MTRARTSFPPALRRAVLLDALVAAVLTVLSLYSLWHPTPLVDLEFREADALGVALTVVGCAGIVLRSWFPITSLVLTAAATLVHAQLGYGQGIGSFAPLLPLYTATVVRGFRTSLALAAATASAVATVLAFGPFRPTLGDWASNLVMCLAAWGLGRAVRNRRRHLRSLEARNRAVQEAREAETRTLLVEERARTVKEMQDLVAHTLTEVGVQVAAARRALRRDPDAAEELLLGAERSGRAALEEMRRAGGLLGEEPAAALRPQPTLADLDRLVEEERAAGLRIDYRRRGRPQGVAPGLELTAFRLVEEALHQARHRSDRLPVEVAVDAADGQLAVTVTCGPDRDAPVAIAWDEPEHGPDAPLARLRSRVAAYGGVLEVGHRRDGSFRIGGRFPLDPLSTA